MANRKRKKFEDATSEWDILEYYFLTNKLEFSPERLAAYLKEAKGEGRTLKKFAEDCKELVEKKMRPDDAENCGASAPTFTRIAKGDSENATEKIKRPVSVVLLWAIWMCRFSDNVSFTRDELFEANCYGNEDNRNKIELNAPVVNPGSRPRRNFEAVRDKRTALFSVAKQILMDSFNMDDPSSKVYSSFDSALRFIESSNRGEADRIGKALCEKITKEEWEAKFRALTSGKSGFDPVRILECGTTDYSPFDRVEHDVFKIDEDPTMFWVFVYCDPKLEVTDNVFRCFMPVLFRDQWEPETLPDSLIKTTFVCTDLAQFEAFKKYFEGRKVNSLMSVMYINTEAYRDKIYEHILPRTVKKTGKIRFPDLEE